MCKTNLPHSHWSFTLMTASHISQILLPKRLLLLSSWYKYDFYQEERPLPRKRFLDRGIGDYCCRSWRNSRTTNNRRDAIYSWQSSLELDWATPRWSGNREQMNFKQASRSWNLHLMRKSKSLDEPCVYMKASGSTVSFLILYADDIRIIGNNIPMLKGVKHWLESCLYSRNQDLPR